MLCELVPLQLEVTVVIYIVLQVTGVELDLSPPLQLYCSPIVADLCPLPTRDGSHRDNFGVSLGDFVSCQVTVLGFFLGYRFLNP
jgi:hypothetical protein